MPVLEVPQSAMTTLSNILEAVFDYIEHQLVLAALERAHREQRRSSRRAEVRGGTLKVDWD